MSGGKRRRVMIVGAGGFGRETAALLHAMRDQLSAIGFVDDEPSLTRTTMAGLPVVGTTAELGNYEDASVVVTVGSPSNYAVKRSIVERLELPRHRYATLIHPAASVGTEVVVGEGTIVLAGTVITHGVTVGRHVGMMPNVVLTHDTVVGDFSILGAGAMLAGGVEVEPGAYIGSGACIRSSVLIGAGALVGMGSVVLNDVPAGQTWAGVPARRLR